MPPRCASPLSRHSPAAGHAAPASAGVPEGLASQGSQNRLGWAPATSSRAKIFNVPIVVCPADASKTLPRGPQVFVPVEAVPKVTHAPRQNGTAELALGRIGSFPNASSTAEMERLRAEHDSFAQQAKLEIERLKRENAQLFEQALADRIASEHARAAEVDKLQAEIKKLQSEILHREARQVDSGASADIVLELEMLRKESARQLVEVSRASAEITRLQNECAAREAEASAEIERLKSENALCSLELRQSLQEKATIERARAAEAEQSSAEIGRLRSDLDSQILSGGDRPQDFTTEEEDLCPRACIDLLPGPSEVLGAAVVTSELEGGDVDLNYLSSSASLVTCDDVVQVNWDGGFVRVGEHLYSAKQIIFRIPSEHTIRGKQYPLELNVVHVTEVEGLPPRVSILAILFEESLETTDEFLDQFCNCLPREVGVTLPLPAEVDGEPLNGATRRGFFRYQGSAAMPTLSDEVEWIVAAAPWPVSPRHIAALRSTPCCTSRSKLRNVRLAPPLHDRRVTYVLPEGAMAV